MVREMKILIDGKWVAHADQAYQFLKDIRGYAVGDRVEIPLDGSGKSGTAKRFHPGIGAQCGPAGCEGVYVWGVCRGRLDAKGKQGNPICINRLLRAGGAKIIRGIPYTATQLGGMLGVSAKKFNEILEQSGYQVKVEELREDGSTKSHWEATEKATGLYLQKVISYQDSHDKKWKQSGTLLWLEGILAEKDFAETFLQMVPEANPGRIGMVQMEIYKLERKGLA